MGCRCAGITWDVLSGRGERLRKGRKMLHKEDGLGLNPFRSIDGVEWAVHRSVLLLGPKGPPHPKMKHLGLQKRLKVGDSIKGQGREGRGSQLAVPNSAFLKQSSSETLRTVSSVVPVLGQAARWSHQTTQAAGGRLRHTNIFLLDRCAGVSLSFLPQGDATRW